MLYEYVVLIGWQLKAHPVGVAQNIFVVLARAGLCDGNEPGQEPG